MGHRQVSDKIKLAPGQQHATYDFGGESFAELGAKLDEFYASLDYSSVTASGCASVSVDITHMRNMQSAEPLLTTIGNHFATVDVYRTGVGE